MCDVAIGIRYKLDQEIGPINPHVLELPMLYAVILTHACEV